MNNQLQTETAQIQKFEAGKTYAMAWNCDEDRVSHHRVIRRTAKSIWVEFAGEIVRRSVKVWDGSEYILAGSYSMAPWLRAENPVD